jgi:hypothetical protein
MCIVPRAVTMCPKRLVTGKSLFEQQFFVFHKKLAPRKFDPKLEFHGNERLTLSPCLEPQLRMPASFKVGRRNPSEPPFSLSNFPVYLRNCLKYHQNGAAWTRPYSELSLHRHHRYLDPRKLFMVRTTLKRMLNGICSDSVLRINVVSVFATLV